MCTPPRGLGGSMDAGVWDLVDVPNVGGQFLADGLTVRSNGDVSTINAGASFLVALSSRVTAQVHYVYSDQTTDHIDYTAAGAVTNLRLAPPYETSQSYHTVGIRFRVWFGSQVE